MFIFFKENISRLEFKFHFKCLGKLISIGSYKWWKVGMLSYSFLYLQRPTQSLAHSRHSKDKWVYIDYVPDTMLAIFPFKTYLI